MIFFESTSADLTNLVFHNEWDVVSMKAQRNVLYYQCCPDPYPDITFSLEIKRKPLFYIMSILFPCILTASVAALGFVLPPESGEKVSLEVTVLLSLAVFLLMVTEQLPASSVNFPYVGTLTISINFIFHIDFTFYKRQMSLKCEWVRNNLQIISQLKLTMIGILSTQVLWTI